MSSTKNIAKNSLFLYIRMFLNMIVSFFTAGVVLNTLGITDYGIYSVVGGFVSMFSFLNSSMSSATQRFLSYDIGKNDTEQLRKTFSSTVTIHFAIALLVVLALETFGLWYINHKLNIPVDRIEAVNIIFQFSVFSTFFGIIQVPYNALITAHERFNVYAVISFIEIGFKLIILYFLIYIEHDKLILYAAMLFLSSFIIRMIYRIYCRRNFPESQYKFYFERSYFKTLLSFTGWNLFGNIAVIARGQGNNLVLNHFFGPALNAAFGITSQFQGLVSNFASSFQLAVNPQIIKNFSSGNIERTVKLMYQSAKFSFGLMLVIVLPILISLQFILDVWLKNYPIQSIIFIQLSLVNVLIDSLSNSLMMGLQATGKIKSYQAVVGFLVFLNLPVSYVMIKFTNEPMMVFITSIVVSCVALWLRLYFLKKQMGVGILSFVKNVIFRVLVLTIIVLILAFKISHLSFDNPWTTFILRSVILSATIAILSYIILLNEKEKSNIKILYKNKFSKNQN